MRVAFVVMETSQLSGGQDQGQDRGQGQGARRIERVARSLAATGHDVTVFCTQWWQGSGRTRTVDGVDYHAVTVGSAPVSFAVTLPVTLLGHRPDVIHARAVPSGVVRAASIAGTLVRAPLVVQWYGDEGLDGEGRASRRVARAPDRVVAPSELVRTRVREFGADDDAVVVVPEGIEYGRIDEVEPASEVDVVYAHPLDESANIESLLLGLAELRDRDWSARVIGDGPRRGVYEQQAADLRIDDRVAFVGACDRDRRLAAYRGAHAFVQTAFRELFATELLWGLACGCLGIVEYQAESSAHELIENYHRGFRVTNPQQLADAIVDCGNYERLTEDDRWAEYDHDAVARRYADVYEQARVAQGLL